MSSRSIRLSVTAAVAAIAAIAAIAPASAGFDSMHVSRIRGGVHGSSTSNPLLYGGGDVELTPKVYIDYWGSQWVSGFTNSSSSQTYVQNFFTAVGGNPWAKTDDQYSCSTTGCVGNITNPTGQFGGAWTDNVALPRKITQSAIAAEALVLMKHFGGYNPSATYFVMTPSGHSMSGFKTSWCAWHSSTTDSSGDQVAYAYLPYQPDAGFNCGQNSVNGYYDGFSIVGGHEYAEAVTDPHPSNGWVDASGSETGDKCAWTNLADMPNTQYAVQPLWSNAAGGCVLSS